MFAAVDASARLWEADGLWLGRPGPPPLYHWRRLWRLLGYALAAVALGVLVPFAIVAAIAVLAPFAVLVDVVVPASGERLVRALAGVASLILYDGLGALLVSRIVLVAALVAVLALAGAWIGERVRSRRRRSRGPLWWEALGAPLDSAPVGPLGARWLLELRPRCDEAAPPGRLGPEPSGTSSCSADNLTQPGYRELLIATHDLETRRDLVFALRRSRTARPGSSGRVRAVSGARRSWISRRRARSPSPTP